MTFNGLNFDISARPISSKKIIDLISSSFSPFSFLDLNTSFAFSNTFKTPAEVLVSLPWKVIRIILGYFLKKLFLENSPFIAAYNKFALRLLLHPGLPQINKGILVQTQTNKANILSNRALFFAMPIGIST